MLATLSVWKQRESLHILPSELPPPRLTDFADFGFSSKMTHRGQVKVTVLVYQSNLPFSGWAKLVQSYLHHLQLHMNNDTHKHKGKRERRSEWWRDNKRSGKERKRGREVCTVTQQAFCQVCVCVCMWETERERERHRVGICVSEPVCERTCVCVFGQSQLASVQCLGAVEYWQTKPCWQTVSTATSTSFPSLLILSLFLSLFLLVWLQSPSPILSLCLIVSSPSGYGLVYFFSTESHSERTVPLN